jgi:diguanylate cyclase (GGDEF)-like protein
MYIFCKDFDRESLMNLTDAEHAYYEHEASAQQELIDKAFDVESSQFTPHEEGLTRTQRFSIRIRRYARDRINSRVSTFIEVFRKYGKFPDDEDVKTFSEQSKPYVMNILKRLSENLRNPFGEDVPESVVEAMESTLDHDLQGIFREALTPLLTFHLEGKVEEEKAEKIPVRDPALIDPNLQILRKEAYIGDVEIMIDTAQRDGRPLSLIVVDLDKFSDINNGYGHTTGDEVLSEVASVLRDAAEGRGQVYRFGGEEFCILLQNHTADEAVMFAERIRSALEARLFSSKSLKVTASLGVAELPLHANTAKELIEFADSAMYESKRLGRNLVRFYGEAEPSEDAGPAPKLKKKLPVPGLLSDEALQKIRFDYFRHYTARCPHDDAVLKVEVLEIWASTPPTLLIECPLCGLEAQIEPH